MEFTGTIIPVLDSGLVSRRSGERIPNGQSPSVTPAPLRCAMLKSPAVAAAPQTPSGIGLNSSAAALSSNNEVTKMLDESQSVRFWEKVTITEGCWYWTGAVNRQGYGNFYLKQNKWGYAHRISYAMKVGNIPSGLEADHTCMNRACVNPDHLEFVTRQVQLKRRDEEYKRSRISGKCIFGHILSDKEHIKRAHPYYCWTCHLSRVARRKVKNA